MHRILGIAILIASIACLVPFFVFRHQVGPDRDQWKVGLASSPWLERTTTKAKLGATPEFQLVTETHIRPLSWSWLLLLAGFGLFYLRGKVRSA